MTFLDVQKAGSRKFRNLRLLLSMGITRIYFRPLKKSVVLPLAIVKKGVELPLEHIKKG